MLVLNDPNVTFCYACSNELYIVYPKPLKIALIGSLTQARAVGMAYIIFQILKSTSIDSGGFTDLGFVVTAGFAYIPLVHIFSIFGLKIVKAQHWLRVGLVAGLAQLTSEYSLRRHNIFVIIIID